MADALLNGQRDSRSILRIHRNIDKGFVDRYLLDIR